MFRQLNLRNPIELYNGYDYDTNLPFQELLDNWELSDDMFQATYFINGSFFTIDIGVPCGAYIIQLVKNSDWENPLFEKATKDYKKLEKYMLELLLKIEKLQEKKSNRNVTSNKQKTKIYIYLFYMKMF